jgi:hypothetical protein
MCKTETRKCKCVKLKTVRPIHMIHRTEYIWYTGLNNICKNDWQTDAVKRAGPSSLMKERTRIADAYQYYHTQKNEREYHTIHVDLFLAQLDSCWWSSLLLYFGMGLRCEREDSLEANWAIDAFKWTQILRLLKSKHEINRRKCTFDLGAYVFFFQKANLKKNRNKYPYVYLHFYVHIQSFMENRHFFPAYAKKILKKLVKRFILAPNFVFFYGHIKLGISWKDFGGM